MDENFGNTIVELIDDENNKYQLEHLDTLEYEDRIFMAFAPIADDDEDEEGEVDIIILESQEEDGEEFFATVDDDELLESVFAKFMERIEQLDSELDNMEELD